MKGKQIMKKLLLTLAIASLAVMTAYAEEKAGAVVSVAGTQLVVDENGTEVTFDVAADAVISDAEGAAVALNSVTAGTNVKVEYTAAEDKNTASAVSVVAEEVKAEEAPAEEPAPAEEVTEEVKTEE